MGFVENCTKCQELLREKNPDIPIFGDIREFDPSPFSGKIDLMHGGFPCTDISQAGRGEGIEGEHSGLWAEFIRCICVVRPRYVIVENVSKIAERGLGVVLGCLAFGGYNAEWDCISADSIGAPHNRERIWFLGTLADPNSRGYFHSESEKHAEKGRVETLFEPEQCRETLADPIDNRLEVFGDAREWNSNPLRSCKTMPERGILDRARDDKRLEQFRKRVEGNWRSDAGIRRVAPRPPPGPYREEWVHRIICCGNTNPPQIMQYLGELILENEERICR